ncbi:penicillin-binding protein 2 [Sporosarcina sp. JAI121]|uniref:peptidoglycan D,D-transpeptidase FtsI family protein n=1 Tax=Sporosarcina sp. JAI121 TaxID=2723064 RepID=UPI0015CE733D|nr:penicillin-binding protein 2 [Sporosarcina sp. JAI121]NYF24580.1 cell division protein FtsI/penicillin-binding protein 2 [Sporosarcina sp. JAI121]
MKKPMRKAEQAKTRQRRHIAFRMNFLFFSIFVLFSLLIFRLGYLQIVKGEDYSRALERTEEVAVNTSVPRGRLFDRTGRVLVDNEPKNAITYTKMTSTSAQEMLEIAQKLAVLIEQDTKRITIGDKRDFWILNNPKEALKKVSEKEQLAIEKDSSLSRVQMQRKINMLTRERVTEKEIDSFTDDELEVLAIYREMMSGYAYSPQIVKSGNVSEEEFAKVSERLGELPGVDTTTDWERVKKSENTILGSTTSPIEGIPDSRKNYFLARDYSRNDRVGKSYIEQYYEELLKGQKTIVKNIKDRSGRVVETKTIREGEPGKDLVLTIDSELQEEIEKIVSEKLLDLKRGRNTGELDRAFLVMMNPNNGEVLALVGKQVVTNQETGKLEIWDYAYGTFTALHEAGSTVKMATLLTGYHENVVRIGERKIDEPLKIGSQYKRSLFNQHSRVSINDVEAIGRSSNVYMFKIAISLAKANYRFGEALRIDKKAFDTFRQSFASFGLGTKTGIDLPGESPGLIGNDTLTGFLLDLSVGQYDTYSTLQLAQYVSTIANGGYRIAPKVLKEIREPSEDGKILGPLIQETDIKVLNRIQNTDAEINQVKRGMHYVYYGANGTAKNLFAGKDFDAGGKTGTAQAFSSGKPTINLSHVGFAPYENPEIAYAIIIPNITTKPGDHTSGAQNKIIQQAVDKYFELKAKRASEENASGVTQPIIQAPKVESEK